MKEFDVIVFGGGPGGYVSAIRAAQLGKKVALIEKESLGGVCLNWGCIPTKSLLKSTEVLRYIKKSTQYGIEVSDIKINITKIIQRSRDVANRLSSGINFLMQKNNIEVFHGFGFIEDVGVVSVDRNLKLKTKNLIIATGARSRILEGFEPDGDLVLTSKEAMIPTSIPKSIIIIGSGAIGIEFASFYNAIGSRVTVLESQKNILPMEDIDVSEFIRKTLEKEGIKFITSVKLGQLIKNQNIKLQILEQSNIILESDKLLVATGIVSNIEGIGIENTKIQVSNNKILTNRFMQTAEAWIYAIGDVVDGPALAHKASYEGVIAAEHLSNLMSHPVKINNIPSCIYSYPQVARVGMTEKEAVSLNRELKIGKFSLSNNGKSVTSGDDRDGFVKTIIDSVTGEILGAHFVGADVTELIYGVTVAKNLEATDLDLINSIFPHPTISEAIQESVLAAHKKAIHSA